MAAGAGERSVGLAAIGADGIHSQVRRTMGRTRTQCGLADVGAGFEVAKDMVRPVDGMVGPGISYATMAWWRLRECVCVVEVVAS